MSKKKSIKKVKKALKKIKSKSQVKSVLAFSAEIGKVYLTKLGVQVLIKKIASNGVQVIPQFSTKTLVVKRNCLLFSCPRKRISKKTAVHFKNCFERSKEEALSKNIERTEKVALSPIQDTLSDTPPQSPSPTQVHRGPKGPRHLSVTNVVDPMLLAGIYTRQQINVALGESEVGKSLANRDMGWYTAYRISVLKEKGYLFEKLQNDIIRIYNPVLNLGVVKSEPDPVLVVLKS